MDVPTYPPAGKRLTIYMLESSRLDDQIQMTHDHLLPLVEEIHPTQANKITWMLLEDANNFEIIDTIPYPELLRTKVDEMDALLKAREAGCKPVRIFNENWTCADNRLCDTQQYFIFRFIVTTQFTRG
ncbi:polyadenylate-binding protein 1-like isoform X1 [Ictalurus furcatus]|uniref:polyadenylate-binding protein 1-like isoform X1 n=1 Tax=Ictalurus furcatus TaxID=66913 RepID=UPI00234FE9CD|nr:polyadenylate-binding protein 1-like isoform X1 [Ictalurus furcatus]